MKRYAIVVAGGSGKRISAGFPKQFILIDDKPVLMHTITAFHKADNTIEIIVVLPKNEIDHWKVLCNRYSVSIKHEITEGGATRFHSVKNGLKLVKEKSIVAIHDGVRPFAGTGLINTCYSEATIHGNAVPAIPMNESIRRVEGDRTEIADRSAFVIVQTPQCFDSEILKSAYNADYRDMFTDDAAVAEFYGESIHLVEGERDNIKITFPIDLLVGEAILKKQAGRK